MAGQVFGLIIRKATSADIDRVVRLSNDGGADGKERESLPSLLPSGYFDAFRLIQDDPKSHLMVAELNGEVVGTFHLTYIFHLAGKGKPDA